MGVKEDKPNTPKKPFIYYYTIMMVVLMALNLFLMPMYRSSQVTEVPYSTFLDMVDQGVVTSVERSDDEIVFLVKTGNKTVTLEREGVVTNIINRLVSGSTWLTLKQGENKFYVRASEGLSSLKVRLIHRNAYLGV